MIPWSDVEKSKEYQTLPPDEQQAAKTQYFQENVTTSPGYQKLPPEEQQAAQSQFMGVQTTPVTEIVKPPSQRATEAGHWVKGGLMKTAEDLGLSDIYAGIEKANARLYDLFGAKGIAQGLQNQAQDITQTVPGNPITRALNQGIGSAAVDIPKLAATSFLGPANMAVWGGVEGAKQGGLPGAALGAISGGLQQGIFGGLNEMPQALRIPTAAGVGYATGGGTPTDRISNAVFTAGMTAPGKGMSLEDFTASLGKGTQQFRGNLASKMMNGLIRTNYRKDFMFGEDPGLWIAKEGLTANNLPDLESKVSDRVNNINDELTAKLASDENLQKVKDYRDAIVTPFQNELTKQSFFGKTNKPIIDKLNNVLLDLGLAQTTPPKLDEFGKPIPNTGGIEVTTSSLNMNPLEATQLKRQLGELANWKRDASSEDVVLSKTIKKAYRNIDSTIDSAVPEVKQLNDRLSNGITAQRVVSHQVDFMKSKGGLYGGRLGALLGFGAANIPGALKGFAIEKALTSPTVRTNVAAWLARATPQQMQFEFTQNPGMWDVMYRNFGGVKGIGEKFKTIKNNLNNLGNLAIQ